MWKGNLSYTRIFNCAGVGTSAPHIVLGSSVFCILESIYKNNKIKVNRNSDIFFLHFVYSLGYMLKFGYNYID